MTNWSMRAVPGSIPGIVRECAGALRWRGGSLHLAGLGMILVLRCGYWP